MTVISFSTVSVNCSNKSVVMLPSVIRESEIQKLMCLTQQLKNVANFRPIFRRISFSFIFKIIVSEISVPSELKL